MGQEQFVAIMPYIVIDLIAEIVQQENINEDDAMKKLYASKLYASLEDEETKIWQYSTKMLYNLFEQEQSTGVIQFPDV